MQSESQEAITKSQRFNCISKIIAWCWKICGLYKGQPQSSFYRVYRYLFHLLLMVIYLFTLFLNMFMMQTFEQLVLYVMYIVFTEVVVLMKARITYSKFDELQNLNAQTVGRDFQPKDEAEDSLHRKGVSVVNYYLCVYFTTAHLAIGSALLYLLHKDYRLPYFPWMFGIEYGPSDRVNYGIMFAYQVLGMYFHMLITTCADVQLCHFLGMIGIQLDLLAKRFQSLRTSEQFENTFVELVNHYQKIDRMARNVERVYSPALFAQFSASGLVICATAFKASSMFNLYDVTAIQNLFYMLAMVLQMYLPCRFGNEITCKSNDLRTAIYSSGWYNMGMKERKTIHMLLLRMNKPLTLKIYYFFNYNLQTYTTTLNIAYSVYALLQRNALKGT